VELIAGVGRKQIPAFRIATGAHPKEETNFRRKAQALDELGQKEGKTFVVMGDGEALDDVIDGITNGYRQEGEPFQQEVRLEAGIAGEQLVSAVPAKDGFNLGGGEPGKEPGRNEGGIAQGFVEPRVNLRKGGDDLRWGKSLVMVLGANPASHLLGKGKFIVGGFGEADGKGVELFSG
jgi:hypothetical protein